MHNRLARRGKVRRVPLSFEGAPGGLYAPMKLPLETLRRVILTLLCLSTVINYIDRQALSVLVPTLRGELGLSSADYGNITTIFLVAYTMGQVVMGSVVDRIGTRRGFVLAICIWSVAAAAHAAASSGIALAIARFALGLGEAGNWPAGVKAVGEWFPRERRGFAMGVFDGGSALGAILAPPLVALLVYTSGWRSTFLITGALGFIWLLFWLPVYWNPAQTPYLTAEDRRRALEEGSRGSAGASSYWTSFAALLRLRELWGLMATRMLATPVWWFYVFWLPDYLSKGRNLSLAEIGYFAWLPFVAVDLGKLTGGSVSDRLLRQGYSATIARKLVMGVAAGCMMGGLFVVNAPNAAGALAWISLATFGFGMWSANILALHADMFPGDLLATSIGWTGTAASLGGAVFTYVIGQVVDRSGYGPVFTAAGLAALFAFAALLLLVGKVEPQLASAPTAESMRA